MIVLTNDIFEISYISEKIRFNFIYFLEMNTKLYIAVAFLLFILQVQTIHLTTEATVKPD